MTLRKITIDNSVKCISKVNNSQSDFKPKTSSLPKKQNKKLSQNKKKFFEENITGERFGIIE